MKSLRKKILNTLIVSAILLPIMNAQGMSYLPQRWFSKTSKAAKEAVKKEAEKVVDKVVEKTSASQYAAQGVQLVAKAAGKTIVAAADAAEFALDHPKLSLATAAGVCLYINRNKIKAKLEEYKPYLKVAGGGIAAAGALIAAKNIYDIYHSFAGSNVSQASAQLPTVQIPKQPEVEKINAPAPAQENFEEYETLWNEFQQEQEKSQQAERENAARIEVEHKKELAVQEAVWQEAEQIQLKEAAARNAQEAQEIKNLEGAWQEIQRSSQPIEKPQLPTIIAQLPAQPVVAPSAQPAVNISSAVQAHPLHSEETPEEYGQRFSREFSTGQIGHDKPLIHQVFMPQPIPIRESDTPWVEEFNEYAQMHPWADEFKEQQEAQKVENDLLESLEENDESVAIVSDSLGIQPARDIQHMARLQNNLNWQTERMRAIMHHVAPENPGRVRIITNPEMDEQNSLHRVQRLIWQLQEPRAATTHRQDSTSTPRPAAIRAPARL